jgi:hypothetical protein
MLKTPVYRTDQEIEQLVREFEAGTLPNSEFNHHAHMTVAIWYLAHAPYPQAVERMRTSIRLFAARQHHEHLYNETITLFWLKLLRHVLDHTPSHLSLADATYQILSRWGSMQFVFKHYTKELAFSEKAKQSWVEPDVRDMGFEVT